MLTALQWVMTNVIIVFTEILAKFDLKTKI